jgi:putative FmdB family regulatory protein
MPLYDFSCTECGVKFEKRVPFQTNQADVTCPKGHRAVRRIISPPQVVFKGSGWYSTDHRGGGKPTTASTTK